MQDLKSSSHTLTILSYLAALTILLKSEELESYMQSFERCEEHSNVHYIDLYYIIEAKFVMDKIIFAFREGQLAA